MPVGCIGAARKRTPKTICNYCLGAIAANPPKKINLRRLEHLHACRDCPAYILIWIRTTSYVKELLELHLGILVREVGEVKEDENGTDKVEENNESEEEVEDDGEEEEEEDEDEYDRSEGDDHEHDLHPDDADYQNDGSQFQKPDEDDLPHRTDDAVIEAILEQTVYRDDDFPNPEDIDPEGHRDNVDRFVPVTMFV
jgi:hypothetical protein